MRRRLAITGTAVFACLAFATACTSAPGAPATPTTPAKSGTELLSEASAKTNGQSFTYTLKYGESLTAEGSEDSTGTKATRTVSFKDAATGVIINGQVLLVGDGLYVKLDLGPLTSSIPGLGGLGEKWLTVDQSKVAGTGLASGIIPGGDSTTPERYIAGVTEAERVSDTEIKGTIDLGKSAPKVLPAADVAKLSADAKQVPFTATLDDQGRFSKIVISLPAVGAFPAADMTTTYADYGAAVDLSAPAAADTLPAPELIYQFLR